MSDRSFPTFLADFEARVGDLRARWSALPDDERLTRRPHPGGWSAKELVGHLIDSAANNHQRFVRARLQDDLRFQGYDQNAWVANQAYRSAPWSEIVSLWASYNLHLARVLRAVPKEVLEAETSEHNFDQIAWSSVAPGARSTLAWFARDYVGHLEHHLEALETLLRAE